MDFSISLRDELEVSRNSVTFSDQASYYDHFSVATSVSSPLPPHYIFRRRAMDLRPIINPMHSFPVIYSSQSEDLIFANFPPTVLDEAGNPFPEVVEAWVAERAAYRSFWEGGGGSVSRPDYDAAISRGVEKRKKNKENQGKPPDQASKDVVKSSDRGGDLRFTSSAVFSSQSGEIHMNTQTTDRDKAVLTTYDDDTELYEQGLVSARDNSYYIADTPDLSPADFFKRPVLLASLSWPVGVPFPEVILNPADLFWKNKRVVNRLNNHSLMKCDMCVRFMVNGSPFHYGALLAAVYAIDPQDQYTNVAINTLDAWNISASQRPHVYLDPTTSQGGCLRVPFLSPYNAYDVTNTDVATSSTIHVRNLVSLRHVSGVIEPITITIVAWAENVVLAAPTIKSVTGLVAQSGDEYGDGVVSRPAYVLAKVASGLSRVPFIGPYALATSIGAKSVGDMAKLFGFSKPNIVSDITFMNPRRTPNFASSTQHDPIYKLTFDDKAGVTVDPRVTGVSGEDEMTISSIAQRESYLTQFNWGQAVVPGSRLFQIAVTPAHFQAVGNAPGSYIHPTPATWLAQPFRYWKGTMRLRLRCVASSFHRGRLRVVYDPCALASVLGSNVIFDHNLDYTYVWDISKEKEAVIDVGWHSKSAYLETPILDPALAYYKADPSPAGNLLMSTVSTNGSLSVIVMNELTAPDTNLAADVAVTVMVSFLDDFEVACPEDTKMYRTVYTPQSGQDMEDSLFPPVAMKSHVTFGNRCTNTNTNIIHFGDPVRSLRSLLKRYTYSYTEGVVQAAGAHSVIIGTFPLQPGKALGAIHTGYNYTTMNPLTYFSPAYLARRGAMRVRLVPLAQNMTNVLCSRYPFNTNTRLTQPFVPGTNVVTAKLGRLTYLLGGSGWNGSNPHTEPGIAVDAEAPYHSNLRYYNNRIQDRTLAAFGQDSLSLFWRILTPLVGAPMGFDVFYAAGEDFSLTHFICVPPMRVSITPPP